MSAIEEAPAAYQERASETSIVRVVSFPPVWGRSISPFALKLEAWMRLAGIPFETRPSLRLDKAPKGKFPYIQDGPERLGDTSLIIAHLKASRGIDPDAALDAAARAQAVMLQRVFEDHLYFAIVYSRWIDPEGWRCMREPLSQLFPAPLRAFVGPTARRRVRRQLLEQGTGRHSRDEVYALAQEDLEAASTCLGDRYFFLGEQLSTIDAVAYGFLANILRVPIETELKRIAASYDNLVAWCDVMEHGLYGGS